MKRIAILLVLAACASPPKAELSGNLTGWALPDAVARPRFTLQSTTGASFDFEAKTRGKLTLLFFGYTHCPDVCPATMQNIAAVTNRMTSRERDQVAVVFVTTDPGRDSLPVLKDWLRRFDPEFVGLTGSVADLEAAQRAAGVAPAIRDTAAGNYTVSHAAQVLVYSPDDSGHVVYPFGTRQSEWAADLPKLLTRWPAR